MPPSSLIIAREAVTVTAERMPAPALRHAKFHSFCGTGGLVRQYTAGRINGSPHLSRVDHPTMNANRLGL